MDSIYIVINKCSLMKFKKRQSKRSNDGSAIYVLIMPIVMLLLLPGLIYVALIPVKTQAKSRAKQVTDYDSQVQAFMLEGNYVGTVNLPNQDDVEDIVSQLALTGSDECLVSNFDDSDDQVSGQIVCTKNDQSNSSDFLITLLEDGDNDDDVNGDDSDDDDDDDNENGDDYSGFPYDGEDWKKDGDQASDDPCDTGTTFFSSGRYSPDHIKQHFDADPDFNKGGNSKWCYKLHS